jgi:hypothetical protein
VRVLVKAERKEKWQILLHRLKGDANEISVLRHICRNPSGVLALCLEATLPLRPCSGNQSKERRR